jgi:hypothetical protein
MILQKKYFDTGEQHPNSGNRSEKPKYTQKPAMKPVRVWCLSDRNFSVYFNSVTMKNKKE